MFTLILIVDEKNVVHKYSSSPYSLPFLLFILFSASYLFLNSSLNFLLFYFFQSFKWKHSLDCVFLFVLSLATHLSMFFECFIFFNFHCNCALQHYYLQFVSL